MLHIDFLYDDIFPRVNMTWLVIPSLDSCFCFDIFAFFSLSFVLMRLVSVSLKCCIYIISGSVGRVFLFSLVTPGRLLISLSYSSIQTL